MDRKARGQLAKRSRRKGHDLERFVVNELKEIGYNFCKTARLGSKILDDCGVDVVNGPPLLIQCKSGYSRSRPKFEQLAKETRKKIEENIPAENPEHDWPYILVHKIDGRAKDNFQVIMNWETFRNMLNESYEQREHLKQLSKYVAETNLPKELRYIHGL